MLDSLLQWCLDPRHAGTIIACLVALAFIRLAIGESKRRIW